MTTSTASPPAYSLTATKIKVELNFWSGELESSLWPWRSSPPRPGPFWIQEEGREAVGRGSLQVRTGAENLTSVTPDSLSTHTWTGQGRKTML